MTIDRVKELYDDYLFDMNLSEEQRSLRGAFGRLVFGSGGQDGCNIRFAEKMEKALAGFDFEREDPEELMDFVLCKGAEYKNNRFVALMMTAMQRFLIPFTEHISSEKAAAILRWYDTVFDKTDMTPVMKDFKKALRRKAKKD